jgi:hypothetical protein
MLEILKYLDLFGISYNFLINGEDKYRTISGGLITTFYCIIIIALFFGFGLDLYQRKNPNVSLNVEVGQHFLFNTSNSEVSFAYRVEDENGQIFQDSSIVTPFVYFITYEMVNGTWENKIMEKMPPKKCHEIPNYKDKEELYNISLENWYCIDFEGKQWGGNWDANFVNYFQINIDQCLNWTDDNITCASPEKFAELFYNERSSGNLYYSQMTMSVQPSMNNFAQPIKTSLINYYQMLNMEISKRKVQTFKFTSIFNDIGWFFEQIINDSVINLDSSEFDFTFKDKWTQALLFSTYNYLGNKRETYNRSYTKIQQILASVGGFSKIFYSCVFLLYFYMSKVYRNLILINQMQFSLETKEIQNNNVINIGSKLSFRKADIKPKEIINVKNLQYSQWLFYFMCKKKFKPELNKVLDNYKEFSYHFQKKFDVFNYLKTLYELKNIKKILLNEQQISHLKEKKKIIVIKLTKKYRDDSEIQKLKKNIESELVSVKI